MTIYEFSVITSDGFPYYHLSLKNPPKGIKLYLRFFDFTQEFLKVRSNSGQSSSFELNAGFVSALFKFACNMDKKIEILEFNSNNKRNDTQYKSNYEGNVLITTQTESYLLHQSVYEKIKLIYELVIFYKIPLQSSMHILGKEEDKIIDILTDSEARKRVSLHKKEIYKVGNEFLNQSQIYGVDGICITSFDFSPIIVLSKEYSMNDIDTILRNMGVFPKISPLEWIYRQSYFNNEQIWVCIYKSDIGPNVGGLFEPYFYLLFSGPNSYLGEVPGILGDKLNKILG